MELAPDSAGYRDTRGLTRALSGELEKAAEDLSEAHRYSNEAAMHRFMEEIFQNHASGNRLAARSDQTGPVDPQYCAERIAWFNYQRPAQQRRPQSDARNQRYCGLSWCRGGPSLMD